MRLKGVLEDLRRDGTRSTCRNLVYRGFKVVAPYRAVCGLRVHPDEVPAPELLHERPELESRFLAGTEIRSLARSESTLASDFTEAALAAGDRCFGVLNGDRLVSYCWFANRPAPAFDGLVLHFDRSYLYGYKAFTHPEYRGRRLFGLGVVGALNAATRDGFRGLISYVERDNVRSLRACERLGHVVFGVVRVVGRGPRAIILPTRGCAQYSFTLAQAPAGSRRLGETTPSPA